MTPRNPLDGKVIINRHLFKKLCILSMQEDNPECVAAWRQNLTGWAAVVVKPTKEQLDKAIGPMPDYRPDDDDFDDLEYEMASHDRHEGKMYWECLLEANPPLPGDVV